MTPDEKSRLIAMRKAGRSYTEIADELGISKNTIKTFCRRNGLAPEAEDIDHHSARHRPPLSAMWQTCDPARRPETEKVLL